MARRPPAGDPAALERYRAKRRLDRTPEPGPHVGSSAQGDRFVVQKHAARRLHYDFRLELDGVLKSWAVPKGPSLDPDDKHLAVHVEDHPLDYADFEGVIPKGQYGGGAVMVWDRGRWFPEEATAADPRRAYEGGKLKFRLEGQKLRGRWMLVRMKGRGDDAGDGDGDNWLLFKEADAEARRGEEAAITVRLPDSAKTGRSVEQIANAADQVWNPDGAGLVTPLDPAAIAGARRARLPAGLEPELATLVPAPPPGDDWLHEIKFDGYRVVCRLEGGEARLFTRRGADWTSHFPTLIEPLRQVPADTALLDGEVVYVGDDGRTSFRALASALQGGTDPRGAIVYYVFDLVHLNGFDLTRAPLVARKEALRRLLAGRPAGARVRFVDHVEGRGDEFYRQACGFALEGAVAKRAAAPYRSGRGRDWLKVKCVQRQEFLITGFTERSNDAAGVGALLVGFHDGRDGPVRCAGRVGTGWDEKTMRDLRSRLDVLVIATPPCLGAPTGRMADGVRWVEPSLVAEVRFLEWNGRDALRHASFEGLRADKPAGEVVFEQAAAGSAMSGGSRTAAAARDRSRTAAAARDRSRAADPVGSRAAAAAGGGSESPKRRSSPDATSGVDGRKARAESGGAARQAGSEAGRGGGRPAAAGARLAARGDDPVVVAGVAISHPDRVVYPDIGLTKLDVARYYEEVAESIIPYVARRPLTLVRCPQGVAAQCFFQKHAADHFPDTILEVPIREGRGTGTYVAVESLAGLLALVQMGALEFHVWGSRRETLERPDQMVFDLDPAEELPFTATITAAVTLRGLLSELGLGAFVKTSGGKGLHVVVPLLPTRPWDDIKDFSHAVADLMVRADPARYLATMSRKKRAGKVYIDYLRNGRGATFVAPYSTRRRAGAPVSAPLRWDELTARLRPDRYTASNLGRRLARLKSDPWQGYAATRQEITGEMMRRVGVAARGRSETA